MFIPIFLGKRSKFELETKINKMKIKIRIKIKLKKKARRTREGYTQYTNDIRDDDMRKGKVD